MRAQVELLRNPPDAESANQSDDTTKRDPSGSASPQPADKYETTEAPLPDTRDLNFRSEAESFIHPDLRAAHEQHSDSANMMPIAPPSGHSPGSQHQEPSTAQLLASAATHHQNNLAPAPPQPQGGGPDPHIDGRSRPKRELSQTKRAAQNRAAQVCLRPEALQRPRYVC